MGWVDHDRLGFNYRLTERQAALGVAQLERLDELLADAGAAAALYTERLAALDYGAPAGEGDPAGLVLPCADQGEERRSWFVYAVRLPARRRPRRGLRRPRPARGRGEGLHAEHPPDGAIYRERFGYREGQFPVAEDASARLAGAAVLPADRPRSRSIGSARRSPRPCRGLDVSAVADELVETELERRCLAELRERERRGRRPDGAPLRALLPVRRTASRAPRARDRPRALPERGAAARHRSLRLGHPRRRLHRRGRRARRAAVHRGG